MIINFFQPWISLIAIIFFLALGYFLCIFKINKDNKRRAAEFYKISAESFYDNLFAYALFTIGKSIIIKEHHQSYNLLGHIYEKLGLHDLEAEAFYQARRFIFNNSSLTTEKYNQDVTYYFYRESLAYTKANNWEFAYLRSNNAVNMIQSKKLPIYVDDKNIEVELRIIRMISSLHFFSGKEAFEKSQIDAYWLKENSTDDFTKKLSLSMNNISTFIANNDFTRILLERCFGKIFSN